MRRDAPGSSLPTLASVFGRGPRFKTGLSWKRQRWGVSGTQETRKIIRRRRGHVKSVSGFWCNHFGARKEWLESAQGLLTESKGHSLALTVLCVQDLLDGGTEMEDIGSLLPNNQRHTLRPTRTAPLHGKQCQIRIALWLS